MFITAYKGHLIHRYSQGHCYCVINAKLRRFISMLAAKIAITDYTKGGA